MYRTAPCRSSYLILLSAVVGSQEVLFHLLQHPEITSSLKRFTEGKQKLDSALPSALAGLDETGEHMASATSKKAVIGQEQTDQHQLPGLPWGSSPEAPMG